MLDRIIKRYKRDGIVGVFFALILKVYKPAKVRLKMRHFDRSAPTHGLNQTENRKRKIIVSLTSYPVRFPTLHICIKSLMAQSYKPDKIVLYLDDFAQGKVSENILRLIPFGLDIEYVSDNLRPHQKYFHAMRQYPEDLIITVDDDIIYERDMIHSLIKSYERYPKAVSARRVHKILLGENGDVLPNGEWHQEYRKERLPSMQLYATGVGGVLYPPLTEKCLAEETLNKDLIRKICDSLVDDMWLKFMECKNGTPVVWAPSGRLSGDLVIINNTQDTALDGTKIEGIPYNDFYISRLQEYFSIKLADYCR